MELRVWKGLHNITLPNLITRLCTKMARGRRLISCFLLFLMVMNIIGHYAFLVLLRNQIAIATEKKIHSNLNEPGGNFIVKLPINTLTEFKEHEPLEGYFTYEGKVYQTIDQRLYQDTLYLVCIHDQRTTAVDHKIAEVARSFAGDDLEGTAALLMAPFAKYYIATSYTLQQAHKGWVLQWKYNEHSRGYTQNSSFIIFHPPKLMS